MATIPLPRSLRCRVATALLFLCVGTGAAVAAPRDGHAPQPTLTQPLLVARVTSGFAMRTHPIKKKRQRHEGVDFAAPMGSPVRVVDDGIVTFAGEQNGYGNVIYVAHPGSDRTTLYAHLDRIHVRKGERVLQGDEIGTVGQTGLASGPHLHFEVHERGRPIDPLSLAYERIVERRTPLVEVATLATPCVELVQKASLEALAADELETMRKGCPQ